jgi:hypothetical protein
MAFVLVRMVGDIHELHRMGSSLADSTSPDGQRQVRLVPISAFCDVNGVVMFRQTGSLWWFPMDRVGDQLTSDRDKVSFSWDNNTQVRLLVAGTPCGTFDLLSGADISKFATNVRSSMKVPANDATPASGLKPGH